jgi:choline dehydrogenase-like flavoprotein
VAQASGKGFFPILQGCAVGGTTAVNGAIIHRLPEAIHREWSERFGLDEGVLGLDLLEDAYNTLDAELSVGPAPEDKLGNNNKLFRKGADSCEMDSNPIQRCVDGCHASSRCTQGCPFGAKQSMDQTFIPFATNRGARVYATCRAERIGRGSDGRISKVRARFRDPVSGRREHHIDLHARRGVILAAGAVHSPWLLLKSGIRTPSRLEGKRFQGHPGTSVLAEFDEPVNMWFGATQGYESTLFWNERMKFEVVGVPPSVAAARLPGYGSAYRERVDRLPYMAHWGVQIRAHAQGKIGKGFFGKPAIQFGLTREDVRLFKRGLKQLVRMAFGAGAIRIYLGIHGMPEVIKSVDEIDPIDDLPDDPKILHGICAHLFGTAGFASQAERGVVDSEGRVYGHDGLYVMDGSVLPTNMGVNPQQTISAFAWLMASAIA